MRAVLDGPPGPQPGIRMRTLAILALAAVLVAIIASRVLDRTRGAPGAGDPGATGVEASAARAEHRFRAAAAELAALRARLGLEAIPGVPGDRAGLIGSELTPLVTTLGSRESKLLGAASPWAKVLTLRLAEAGVGRGTRVAASFSGSFPGLDLALICACEALGAELDAVSSVTASTWGATDPGLTWPEMELHLARSGLIGPVSRGVSVGGHEDRGADLMPEGLSLAREIQARVAAGLGVPLIEPTDLADAVAIRMRILDPAARRADAGAIGLFVSVGGNHASLGRSGAVLRLQTGIIRPGAFDRSAERGLVARFAEQGTPVLLLLNVQELALRWGVVDS